MSLGQVIRNDCISSNLVRSFAVSCKLMTEIMTPPTDKEPPSPRLGNEGLQKLKKIKSSPTTIVKVP